MVSSPSTKVVRITKTRTQSKILANGDMVEQTVVREVTETVTSSLMDGCVVEEEEEEEERRTVSEVRRETPAAPAFTKMGRIVVQ